MKKTLVFCIAFILIFASVALAEETAEYRDALYAFRYPASWSCDTADNGDIVLGSPDRDSAVLTFALISDLYVFTGDSEHDAPLAEDWITSYSGKNLALSGEYTLMQSGELRGIRALGSWRATGQEAVVLLLSGNRHLIGFVLVGDAAIALEQDFMDSVELLGDAPAESTEGYMRWENPVFALDYPSHYSMLDQGTAVAFINPDDPSCIIMAKAYSLDVEYSDTLAPVIAANALPKSTKVEPNAEMTVIGGRNAAVIRGTVSAEPMAFYAIGSGRTALVLMFTGEEACALAEHVISSAVMK